MKGQVVIKRATVFLGGPYHGAVKMVRDDEMAYSLPRRDPPRVSFDDVRTYFATVLYVRTKTDAGYVFIYSEMAPFARARLIEEYCAQNIPGHRAD